MSPGGRVIDFDGSQLGATAGGKGASSRDRPRSARPPPRAAVAVRVPSRNPGQYPGRR